MTELTLTQRLMLNVLGNVEPVTADQLAAELAGGGQVATVATQVLRGQAMTADAIRKELAALENAGMVTSDSPPDSPGCQYTRTGTGARAGGFW